MIEAATTTEDILSELSGGEYEREPVPRKAWLGFQNFVGMYIGEHCAGTEFMIGPMFVACGVGAFDLLVGLLLGNILATLSWLLFTAPIATSMRLTLYYQLEKICGRNLVTLYNLANGVMFCFLAGAMITVSATAVGVWFKFPMPELTDMYPNSAAWVVAVVILGVMISLVAALGYQTVSWFGNLAAPWMLLMFAMFGVIGLAEFLTETNTTISSSADLWNLADKVIWKGTDPLPGQPKFTIWHVTFFAWFCNMAMHIGMSDLSVFRFAKKTWYGIAPGSGMFVGHYVAWIAASVLFALQLHRTPEDMRVLPGPLSDRAAGLAGLICVIIAGWTTANPTIYRAGLAFQAIMPKVPRFWVTFGTGLLATAAGVFPAFAMKLLGFVALYGLILMPMGAVIFVDFWLAKKLGFQDQYAEKSGSSFNWAAGAAWIITLVICVALVQYKIIEIYFVSLPGWFMAVALYILLSKVLQKPVVGSAAPVVRSAPHAEPVPVKTPPVLSKSNPLRIVLQVASWLSLVPVLVGPCLLLAGRIDLNQSKWWLLWGTLGWFATAIFWMGRTNQDAEAAAGSTAQLP